MANADVFVLTALKAEYEAVLAHLSEVEEVVHPRAGTVYEVGLFVDTAGRRLRIALAEVGSGNVEASSETERAIQFLSPQVVMFVGVAGGIKDVPLGDVVVGTKIYGYESGRAEGESFRARPEITNSSHVLIQRARFERRRDAWLARLPEDLKEAPPEVHIGPIAAGEKVVASSRSEIARFLWQEYGDALAVEMEGRGLLVASSSYSGLLGVVVRGISDLLDGKAETDAQDWQLRAAACASAFAFQILANLGQFIEPGGNDKREMAAEVAAAPPELVIADYRRYPVEQIGPTELAGAEHTVTAELWRIQVANIQPSTVAKQVRIRLLWSNPPLPSLPVDLHLMHDNEPPFDHYRDLREGEALHVDVIGKDVSSADPRNIYLYRSDLAIGYIYQLSSSEMAIFESAFRMGWSVLLHIEAIADPPAKKAEITFRLHLAESRNLTSKIILAPLNVQAATAPDQQRAYLQGALRDLRDDYGARAESFFDEPSIAAGWVTEVDNLVEDALGREVLAQLLETNSKGQYFERRFAMIEELLGRIDILLIRPEW